MSYNVENFFDDVHSGTEYPEFDPSRGKWTTDMFLARADAIAEVIRKAVPGGPDIAVLQEVENENALQTLIRRGLTGMGYAGVFVPKPGVSANVAFLSRLPVARVRSFGVGPWKSTAPMRDIVEADIMDQGHTLYVLDNHWKAKTGGARQTERSRVESAGVLARRIEEILAQDPGADIVAAGDMNESADEYQRVGRTYPTALMPDTERQAPDPLAAIYLSGAPAGLGVSGGRLELFDPWLAMAPDQRGSYFFQGDWLTMDHMLLSPGMLDGTAFTYRAGSFGALHLPFLLTPEGTPRSSADPRGHGYSDHLPLLMLIDVKK